MTENLIQAVAAGIIKHQLNLIARKYPVVMQTHDEVTFLADSTPSAIQEAEAFALEMFANTPQWCPGLVLKGSVSSAVNYGDCK
jgi:hypothetical protein